MRPGEKKKKGMWFLRILTKSQKDLVMILENKYTKNDFL